MILYSLLLVNVLPLIHAKTSVESDNIRWIWKCENNYCTRSLTNLTEGPASYSSKELCRLVCGKFGPLWPQPISLKNLGNQLVLVNPKNIQYVYSRNTNTSTHVERIVSIFDCNIRQDVMECNIDSPTRIVIHLSINSTVTTLDWNTDESYSLHYRTQDNQINISIKAKTVFGARHGLETLSQLVAPYPTNSDTSNTCLAIVNKATIWDSPIYRHRGLLLDTSRNYLSIPKIKTHINGMAASKLNFLHWHITDSHSFPMETPTVPNMTLYGAYSPEMIYTHTEIKNLTQYALDRGVRILMELDGPAHAGFGWQWAEEAGLGNLTVCLNQQPWRSYCVQPPCGQLNPSNKNVYQVLRKIYSDFHDLQPWSETFHMGGDEVFIPCWNSSEEILNYIGDLPRTADTFLDLWSEFQDKALEMYDAAVGHNRTKIILWTSHLTDPKVIEKYLSRDRYVIQTWVMSNDPIPKQLLEMGYELIVSTKNAWYLDHGFWGTTTYYNWRTVYKNQIPLDPSVIGGEVCMWGEYVDDSAIEGRVWPRAAAAAERLWSNPVTRFREVEPRFYGHRERLVKRGINAEAIVPRWCYLNDGNC